ncbi:MAG: CHAT domain-containing protein [Caldilineaceae bacterium]
MPSARSLRHALNVLEQRQQHVTVLLGVGNPLPVNTAPSSPAWRSLPNSKIELEQISEQLNQETVYAFYEQAATLTAILPHLSNATLLHLSCHGTFDASDILGSGLQLADGMLTLRDLLDPTLYQLHHLRLAVLSACQTAINDFADLPDESIGLPAGFLYSGAPGVVGSLWPVEDRATALLMRRFYHNFLDKKLEPAIALSEAQYWLRELTWKELGDYYRDIIIRMSASVALQVYNQIVRPKIKPDPSGKPYENPYYWAGFTYTGV